MSRLPFFKVLYFLIGLFLLNCLPVVGAAFSYLRDADQLNNIDSVIIPLKRSGRLFLIDAVIDNQQGNLIFDSGATGLVLNKTYFRKYAETGHQSTAGITGAVESVRKIVVGQVSLGNLNYKLADASLVDLSHIENRRGIKVLGLIGFDRVTNYEINIDLANAMLRLYRIDKKGQRIHPSSGGFNPQLVQNMETFNGIAFVRVTIGGKTLRFCLDTAAETNALSNTAPKDVMQHFKIIRSSFLKGAGTQTREVFYGMFDDIRIGEMKIDSMSAVLSNLEHLYRVYDIRFDGILGYDFFMKGVVRLNFAKRTMEFMFNQTTDQ